MNDIVEQRAFSFFGHEALAFRPSPRSVMRRDANGQNANYLRYDFARTLTAKQAGPIRLAAVTLQGTFAGGVSDGERLRGKEILCGLQAAVDRGEGRAPGRPARVCTSGPSDGSASRPSLARGKSKVGDPLTLTLVLRGSGSLAAVKPPDLSKTPSVAERFKVYEATQTTDADAARFVYSLRPLAEGDEPFPAVAVSYFDADKDRYATLRSDPIPLSITKAQRLSAEQIVASPHTAGATAKELEVRREGIFANITDAGAIRDQSVHPAAWLAGLGGCLFAYLSVATVTLLVRRRTADKSALRRRVAPGRARQRLREATTAWRAARYQEAADRLQDSLTGLVADAAGLHRRRPDRQGRSTAIAGVERRCRGLLTGQPPIGCLRRDPIRRRSRSQRALRRGAPGFAGVIAALARQRKFR